MAMRKLWQAMRRLGAHAVAPGGVGINDALWQGAIAPMAFLTRLPVADQARLRRLSEGFLRRKEFHGLAGLQVTDEMAVQIAAQACRPLLHLGPPDAPEKALRWCRPAR
jgi:Mlc titration factor MtfA (ptsG expression regulator)